MSEPGAAKENLALSCFSFSPYDEENADVLTEFSSLLVEKDVNEKPPPGVGVLTPRTYWDDAILRSLVILVPSGDRNTGLGRDKIVLNFLAVISPPSFSLYSVFFTESLFPNMAKRYDFSSGVNPSKIAAMSSRAFFLSGSRFLSLSLSND